jgi:hypothetical protein
MFILFWALLIVGVAGLVVIIKRVEKGLLKTFLLTAGASLTGIPVFIFLHNAVYGVFIHFFGNDFWKDGDEPVFFVLALIICPLGILVGVMGSIVIGVKRTSQKRKAKITGPH